MILHPNQDDQWVHLTEHLPDDVIDAWWLSPGITLLRLREVRGLIEENEEYEQWALFSPSGELLGRLAGERTPGQARAWAKRKAADPAIDVQLAALHREQSEQVTATEAMGFAWVVTNQGLNEPFIPRSIQALFALMRSALHQARAALPQDAETAHAYVNWALTATPPYIFFQALQPGDRCFLGSDAGDLDCYETFERIDVRELDGDVYNAEHIDDQASGEPLTDDERDFSYIPPWTVVYQERSSNDGA